MPKLSELRDDYIDFYQTIKPDEGVDPSPITYNLEIEATADNLNVQILAGKSYFALILPARIIDFSQASTQIGIKGQPSLQLVTYASVGDFIPPTADTAAFINDSRLGQLVYLNSQHLSKTFTISFSSDASSFTSTQLNFISTTLKTNTQGIDSNFQAIANLQSTQQQHTQQITQNETDIANLQSTQGGTSSDVSGLQASLTSLTQRVNANENNISGNSSSIAGLGSQQTTLESNINNLTTTVNSINEYNSTGDYKEVVLKTGSGRVLTAQLSVSFNSGETTKNVVFPSSWKLGTTANLTVTIIGELGSEVVYISQLTNTSITLKSSTALSSTLSLTLNVQAIELGV